MSDGDLLGDVLAGNFNRELLLQSEFPVSPALRATAAYLAELLLAFHAYDDLPDFDLNAPIAVRLADEAATRRLYNAKSGAWDWLQALTAGEVAP